MRISDWSSDVCSSDLISPGVLAASSIWRASQLRPLSLCSQPKPSARPSATTASSPAPPMRPHFAICLASRMSECLPEADVELEGLVHPLARVEREGDVQPDRSEAREVS